MTERQHAFRDDPDYYEGRAQGLLASAQDGTGGAVLAFARHGAPRTADGARAVVASEHGFDRWDELLEHVRGLRASDDPFVRAYRAIEGHDLDAFRAVLDRFPGLVREVGTNGNDLLGMAAARCDERLVRVLLDHGADVAHGNAHGWTALHQAASSNLPLMTEMLLDAGAPVDLAARGDGGTPLVVALFWGSRGTAEQVAARGLHPGNLRVAAGLGRVELIEELAGGPALAPAAGAARAFYRPHGGFPAWVPSDDPQEILDEALTWAARNGRTEAVDALVARGAEVGADVYRGTALIWAAAMGHAGTVRRLAALGADLDRRATFGGPQHGEGITALHLAAEAGQLDAIRALLELGADPTVRDALYDGTPARWAEYNGRGEALALLRGA